MDSKTIKLIKKYNLIFYLHESHNQVDGRRSFLDLNGICISNVELTAVCGRFAQKNTEISYLNKKTR